MLYKNILQQKVYFSLAKKSFLCYNLVHLFLEKDKKMNQTHISLKQKILESHAKVRQICNTPDLSENVDSAMKAFTSVARKASPTEIEYYKSEYIFLFSKVVAAMKNDKEKYAPQVVALTDWFFAQRHRNDSIYKKRLRDLVKLINFKGFEVSPAKQEAWKQAVRPVRARKVPGPFYAPVDTYHCSITGPQKRPVIIERY